MIKHILYTLSLLISGFVIGFYSRDWFIEESLQKELSSRKPDIPLNNIPENNPTPTIFPDTTDLQEEFIILPGAEEFGPV